MLLRSSARFALDAGMGLALAGTLFACGARSPLPVEESVFTQGTEGGRCYASGACKAGLVCRDDTCVHAAGGGTVAAPSCAPGGAGMTDCGDGSESCCTSLLVVGGNYFRTYTNSGNGATDEADPATVSSFRLDKYEVTVGRFRQFVRAATGADGEAGWLPAAGSGKHTHLHGGQGLANSGGTGPAYETGWDTTNDDLVSPTNTANLACDAVDAGYATWTASAGNQEKLPINCVTVYMAQAFCIWDGGFLPSEAEWEYAAAGGSQQREYPWGTAAPGTANQYVIYNCSYPSGSGHCDGVSNIAPVGTATLGAGAWGQLDLDGNLAEWMRDYWDDGLYADPCTDCAELTAGEGQPPAYPTQAVRGGDFHDESSGEYSSLFPWMRNYASAAGHNQNIGFRCARSP